MITMSRSHRLLLFFGVFVLFTAALRGDLSAVALAKADLRQAPPAQRASGSEKAGVTAVLVDIVVRDKKGMPVRDLQQSEFEILEDGAAQTVGSFTPIFDAEVSPATAPGVATPAPVAAGRSTGADGTGAAQAAAKMTPITALVFDRLSPEGRQLAVNAARAYVSEKDPLPSMMGVFGVDLAFTPYAPFTKDRETLRKALDTIETRASTTFGIDRDQKRRIDYNVATTQQQAGGGGGASIGSAGAAAQLAQMEADMMAGFDALERDEQGYTSVNGLFAIIGAMRQLPGRKSIVLFSEGVAIPPAVHRLFLGVIDAANRANVSIYTMDAAGLRTESEQAKIRDQVNQAGKRGLTSYAPGRDNSGTQPLTKALELNEDVLRQDPHTGLGELAQGTGGLIFESTNNLRTGFDRVESDLRNYYLIGYTPTNSVYDGTFRKIEVKVKRPGLTVAARKGYFAVRDTGGAPVNTWEAPALAALERRPVPNAFPYRAGALQFPSKEKPGLVPVVVDLKTAPLSFPTTEDQKGFKSDFAVIVRFVDGQNKVVRKVSQHYEMSAALDKLDLAKNSDVLFYREPELPPGVYTMETIVYDGPTSKASVRYATVEVPKVDSAKLRMSSLVIVKRGEKIGVDEPKTGPLFVKDVLIYPNLGEAISKANKEVGFFFTVYPGAAETKPEAVLELIENGQPLAQVPLPLDAPDASGQIQQVGRLPVGEIPAGTYELRVIVKQGAEQVFRSAMLHVAD
jgi:VWFA-related protein